MTPGLFFLATENIFAKIQNKFECSFIKYDW